MGKAKPRDDGTTLKIEAQEGKSESRQLVKVAMRPMIRNGFIVGSLGSVRVQGPKLDCQSLGSAGGTRTAAWCVSPRYGDLSCAMVESGTALKWDRYWGNHRC